jgi:hypothetical protein
MIKYCDIRSIIVATVLACVGAGCAEPGDVLVGETSSEITGAETPLPSGLTTITLQAANGQYVVVNASSSLLPAMATGTVGTAAVFQMTQDPASNGAYTMTCPNGLFASAQNGWNPAACTNNDNVSSCGLLCNRTVAGDWEHFIVNYAAGTISLRAYDLGTGGNYVTAENSGGTFLYANRQAAGPWERFNVALPQPPPPPPPTCEDTGCPGTSVCCTCNLPVCTTQARCDAMCQL